MGSQLDRGRGQVTGLLIFKEHGHHDTDIEATEAIALVMKQLLNFNPLLHGCQGGGEV